MPNINVWPSADALVSTVAMRLLDRLADLQDAGGVPQLCLTGGRIANRIYQAMADAATTHRLDWGKMGVWWGDERFVATDCPERNALTLLATLAKCVPLTPACIHVMPAAEGSTTLEQAAAAYAEELGSTTFDICLLSMGPDGHIASLFPDHPSSAPTSATVIAVRESPKPPPERLSLSLPALNSSTEVWVLASGEEKADAVAGAYRGDDLPAAHVQGTRTTYWLLDSDAASKLPTATIGGRQTANEGQ